MNKILVIGLDGATWNLLSQLIEHEHMPTLNELLYSSSHGTLESTVPPVTGPAWVSFATGTNPGKHACFDFVLSTDSLGSTKTITSNDIKGVTFYELLNRHNKKNILINLPCSYPPLINDVTITSLMTKGNNCIFPKELVNEIPFLNNYELIPDMSLIAAENIKAYSENIRNLEKMRFECSKLLFEREWDHFFILFSATDWIQHIGYSDLIDNVPNAKKYLLDIYSDIDEYIKWFLENVSKDTNILMISDHGFKEFTTIFFINVWLEQSGYLVTDKRNESDTSEAHNLANTLKASRNTKKKLKIPRQILKLIIKINEIVSLTPLYNKLQKYIPLDITKNFAPMRPKNSESVAYCNTCESRGIYLNIVGKYVDGIIKTDGEYELIRNKIISELNQLKNPHTGKQLLKALKREDVYFGNHLNNAPDIILELDDAIISNAFFPTIFGKKIGRITNNHDPNGIFLAHGPDIKQGANIEGARIIDLAPTILHMSGVPIPRDMDGRVLTEIFREDSEMAQREIVYEEDKTKAEKNKDTLKNKIGKLKTKSKV